MNQDVINKIEMLIEEAKIMDARLAQQIKDNYHGNTLSNIGGSAVGSVLTNGLSIPAAGLYQGMQNSHPIAGMLNGPAGSLGAVSNNVEGISLKDAFNKTNVAGNLGVLSPIVTPLQYGFGKLFGKRDIKPEEYSKNLKKYD